MLSSGLRNLMKALLILLAAAWITTDANATSEVPVGGAIHSIKSVHIPVLFLFSCVV